jgi:DNA repair protein RadC
MERKVKSFDKLGNFETSPELAEVKVSYRANLRNPKKITSPEDSFNVLYPLFSEDTIEIKEEFLVLFLNKANICLGWSRISSGGISGTVVDERLVFILALLTNSTSIILCHNHPSQNLRPSEADIKLTTKIKQGGSLLGISVLDHLIVASNGSYFTFADEGIL